ncbi:nucleoside phosphorylase [Clostridium rectalis]|uniref:nucleoside phosphorylase n=1 Tax=Clostridium rectalis TaxID=2040295 RepID=UPI000F63BD2A|nr:nucleoside phosphorylase [Clostridium rectalis]
MGTLYLGVTKETVSKYVIFSGDPGRVRKIISYMENVEEIACNREFNTYTGYYEGIKITVTSTGIGGPSAAIAMEEMYECGMEVAVRLGTIMGLKENLGNVLIPRGCMKLESTSKTYVDSSYPAVADYDLINCMNESSKQNSLIYENPIICSMDGYYSEMKELKLSNKMGIDVKGKIENLKKYNIGGIDMESGVILTLSNLMDIKGCVVTMTTVLENLKDYLKGKDRVKAEEDLIKVVLDGIKIYASKEMR